MYTFNIEPLHNENIVTNTYSNTDKKIVGGGDKFKVYKASDFVRIVVDDSTIMKNLCEFFFAYIVYDTLIYAEGKMYYALQKKMLEIEELIIKRLFENVRDQGGKFELLDSVSNAQIFSEHISTLFSVTSSDSAVQSIDIKQNSWDDISSKINLSQGQYLHHLDSVYKKYESVYHNERDDYKLKKILELVDPSLMGNLVKYSFHQKIELKYTQLESIKSSNFFYKTEHFYIQDKNMLKSKFTSEDAIKKLLQEHGIEKLIHIYYTYLSIKDLKELYEFRFNIRKAIAKFMCYNNFDIVNLLIFQDILFYKIIKNGASIIYNTDGQVDPVSKPLLRDTLKVEDNTRDDNINEQFLKHQLFYRYKELEKALRRYYLPHVVFETGLDKTQRQHSAIDIIQIRQTTLEDDVCLLDTAGEIIIDKMKSVTTFYKPEPETSSTAYQPCQLVKYKYPHENSQETGPMYTYCIGKIHSVNYSHKTCTIELLTVIENDSIFDGTIDNLSFKSNNTSDDIKATFIALFKADKQRNELATKSSSNPFNFPTISFDFIYDTSLLFGRLSAQCGFTETVKITYRDFDLFNREFDRSVTYVPLVYNIPFDELNVLFIIPESVQNSRPELKPLGDGTVEPVEPQYAYITFTINNSEKQLKPKTCNTITECEIAGIFKQNTSLSDTYSESSTHCILIEEVKGDKYVKRAFDDNEKLDKLYFSSKEITLTLQ